MNKSIIIILGFLALVLLGVGVLLFVAGEEKELTSDQPVTTMPASPESAPSAEETERYVQYSEEAVTEAQADTEVILFFHAAWCPQCVQLERDLKENGVPAGYTFVEVDFDQNQDLRQQYGVNVQTTLIRIDENGDEVDRHVPYNEPTVSAVMRDFLDK